MPRVARLDAPGVLHHVMGRGIEKKDIFINNTDRNDFLDRLGGLCAESALDVYAWVLMPNHFHILCKTRKRPLASNMRRLLTGYVVNFNRRHNRNGHLFQNRYKSIVVQEDAYLKELVRYIHLNLLRAKIVKSMEDLSRSPYSGHSALVGKVKREWQDTGYVLSYFGEGKRGVRRYQEYVASGINMGRRPELVGGGLIRSQGGWSEVLSLRHRDKKPASDQRILGDSDFVAEVTSDIDDLVKKNLRLSGRRMGIEKLCEMVCDRYGLTGNDLRSGSRRHEIVEARRVVSWIAVRELGYTGAEVGRYLGVTNSCITRFIGSCEKPDVDFILKSL